MECEDWDPTLESRCQNEKNSKQKTKKKKNSRQNIRINGTTGGRIGKKKKKKISSLGRIEMYVVDVRTKKKREKLLKASDQTTESQIGFHVEKKIWTGKRIVEIMTHLGPLQMGF